MQSIFYFIFSKLFCKLITLFYKEGSKTITSKTLFSLIMVIIKTFLFSSVFCILYFSTYLFGFRCTTSKAQGYGTTEKNSKLIISIPFPFHFQGVFSGDRFLVLMENETKLTWPKLNFLWALPGNLYTRTQQVAWA